MQCVELCLPLIIENKTGINEGKATHLFGDFRANMNEWKSLVGDNTNDKIKNFKKEEYKDKVVLFIMFLLNDGVIEGHIYLLPKPNGKMDYVLRVARPVGIDSTVYKEMSELFVKIKNKK